MTSGSDGALIALRVRAEQVRSVYQQLPLAAAVTVVVGGLLCVLLWQVTRQGQLLAWLGLLGAVSVARAVLVVAFRRAAPDADAMEAWDRRFVVLVVLNGLAWGIGGWWVMPAASPLHQAVVYVFLIGMAGGAVASFSTHSSAMLSVVCVLLPSTLWFLLQDGLPARVMGVGGLIYIAAAFRATRSLREILRSSVELAERLRGAHAAAEQLASTDELSGANTRRAFYEKGSLAVEQARRYGRPLALLLLDIDHLKVINDGNGHAAGDAAIRGVGATLRGNARAPDTVGRLGGDEFAMLLPETSRQDAVALAERVRQAICAREGDLTCSIGVAGFDEGCESFDALILHADAALYRAKQGGRDQIASAWAG